MPPQICHLPNGQTFTVKPVFGGVSFTYNNPHQAHFSLPPGWTIIISTKRNRFTRPTLNDDSFYISSVVHPTDVGQNFANSPTREVAMIVWITLMWYFHEPEPSSSVDTEASAKIPWSGKPKGEWGIHIRREGIFKGRNMLQKLERMGLVATEESSVGNEAVETRDPSSWSTMFVSRRSFWQIDPRLFLFTTPLESGPSALNSRSSGDDSRLGEGAGPAAKEGTFSTATGGPFITSSHLPSYYPPPPTQYTFTNGIRHPIRPKPPHQSEVFYVRHVPSVQQYLSFRVPFLPNSNFQLSAFAPSKSESPITSIEEQFQDMRSDRDILYEWMNDPGFEGEWCEAESTSQQERSLPINLRSRHSFPLIGCWDGKPFGFFEIFWVKEDRLGRLLDSVDNYDRGIHLLVEEQEQKIPHRVAIWLSALVHYCWLADMRTQTVIMEPRVDNEKMIHLLRELGFFKEGEVRFPQRQAAVMKIKRDIWESPVL